MKPKTLKEALEGKLTEEEMEKVVRSYDIVGDIAIIDIPEELEHREKLIGETVLSLHKNVNVVCKKSGIHEGEFRTQPLSVVAGEERKETKYRENACTFYLNPETCYFSSRSSTERKRIAELVKEGEEVLVMFSGIGPFPIVIAKHNKIKRIVGVEKNPDAHSYAEKNRTLNKVDVELICGDVNEVTLGIFDRVIMPLPKTGEHFLDVALKALKPGGWLHFYDFQSEFELAREKVEEAAKRAGREVLSSDIVKCGQYAPRVHRVCVDAKIS
ncbi:MAG: class I SAM-dependent methyltransferase [Candidatus Woesearchaeota archaeon]